MLCVILLMHALEAPANRIFKKDMAGASGVNYQLYLKNESRKTIESQMVKYVS